MVTIFFLCKIGRSWRNKEIYKWKWVVLSALGSMNNAGFEKKIEMTTLRLCFKYVTQKKHISIKLKIHA